MAFYDDCLWVEKLYVYGPHCPAPKRQIEQTNSAKDETHPLLILTYTTAVDVDIERQLIRRRLPAHK